MRRLYRREHCAKQLISMLLVVVTLLASCQKKETLPRPEFPLSEAALTAALEETGLSWSIEQTDVIHVETTKKITYSLHRPESEVTYNTVFINSYHSDELGRKLQINFHVPQKKQWPEQADIVRWSDWQETMILAARLYGGFEDAEEIFRACSDVALPQEENLLWQGNLTGGYCRITTTTPIQSWRPSVSKSLIFHVYESEDAYLLFEQSAEKIRESQTSQ